MSLLVTPEQLAADVAVAPAPVILDVRWTLGDPRGRHRYYDGHIPGAVYVDLTAELSAAANPAEGRHPLPSPQDFQAAVRRWGLDDDDRVVIYDDCGNMSAARAWWLLRWAGLREVHLLDGGLGAWQAAGGDLAVGPGNKVRPGSFTVDAGNMPTIAIDEAAEWPDRGLLVDVRAAERYAGYTEPIDKRAGHIPGARNLPTGELLDSEGRFLQVEALRERFSTAGVESVEGLAVYCGSGVHACHTLAALEVAGLGEARLYPGSWSQWAADRERPVALGPEPEPRAA